MIQSFLPWQILRNGLYAGDLLGVGGNRLTSDDSLHSLSCHWSYGSGRRK